MVQVKCVETRKTVMSAIEKLMLHTAWTSRTIIKYIRREFSITDPNIGSKISRALKRGVKLGFLAHEQGRYRLNPVPIPNPSNTSGPKSSRLHNIQKRKLKRNLSGQTYERFKHFSRYY